MRPDMRDVLPRLRKIGFQLWDPLGLGDSVAKGEDMADEYDSALLSAYSAKVKGCSIVEIAAELRQAEQNMGVGIAASADRCKRAAQALFSLADPFDTK
jgi:hypothetical protein